VSKIIKSRGYARWRLINGAIFIAIGFVILFRAGLVAHAVSWKALPVYVLGLAFVMLGAVRFYEHIAYRRSQ
jgi:uncharacterized membrane protein HdeD (DUF308 family)